MQTSANDELFFNLKEGTYNKPLQMINFWGELALAKLLILKWDLLQYLYTFLAICVLLLHLHDSVAQAYFIL